MRGLRGTTRWMGVVAGLGALAQMGCGGGSRQDSAEAAGNYTVDVVTASFPRAQRLAGQVQMVISVRNPGRQTIPNIAVTLEGADGAAPAQAFGEADPQVGLAASSRAIWIIDRAPGGGDTAHVNTWTLGKLRADEQKTFTWYVTPTIAGTHTVRYRVAAGLDGKAKAQLAGGGSPAGTFTVAVSAKPAGAKVTPNGDVTASPPSSKAVPPAYRVRP